MNQQVAKHEMIEVDTSQIERAEDLFPATTESMKIIKAIRRSQRCQRNWDLTRQLSDEQLKVVLTAATECPTKQNIPFFSVKVIQRRDVIEKLYDLTYGPYKGDLGRKNPQVLANTLLIFSENHDYLQDMGEPRNPQCKPLNQMTEEDKRIVHDDVMQAIGIAAGYVNLAASLMGLQTGCCKCFQDIEAVQEIAQLDPGHDRPRLMMGVGFADPTKPRRQDHKDGSIVASYNKQIKIDMMP